MLITQKHKTFQIVYIRSTNAFICWGCSHSDLPWLLILNNELDATAEWPILG